MIGTIVRRVMQQYAILCYDDERIVDGWTADEDAAVLARLHTVHEKLIAAGRLVMTARLDSTGTARSVRKSKEAPVTDGPFAETKEQLLGFYIITAEDEAAAVEAARDLARASSSPGQYEVRPLRLFLQPGGTGP
ncbi:YciI family protein [Caenispirillum bisanense]|uniref:Uncharacterized conserved protein n=1 Tax=Caenispirillum bisanense TaxID=414052 RepID=A0A286GZC9_9PROT|nr:YciI family protein [Caenispirillum bisanense]SOE00822.1 Uncharacterized conserved protein [Caenispirillum bisanense]